MSASLSIPPPLPAACATPADYRHRRAAVVVSVLIAVGVYAFCVDPMTSTLTIPCMFHKLTGLHCPGCGITRAAHALTHARLIDAIGHNPLAVLVLPIIGVRALVRWLKPRPQTRMLPAGWVYGVLVVLIAYWIARNVPVYPFTLLAP